MKSITSLTLVLVIFTLFNNVSGCKTIQDGITWQYDEDTGEVFIDVDSLKTCKDKCLQNNKCKGFTWQPSEGSVDVCIIFFSLEGLHQCDSCTSGTVPLTVNGACAGNDDNIIGHDGMELEEECENRCSQTSGCNYYTWYNATSTFRNVCFLFSECEEVPCTNCASGGIFCLGPAECQTAKVLNDATRNINNGNGSFCDKTDRDSSQDWQGPGWYKLESPAGNRLPEDNPGFQHCGTTGAGWLRTGHPANEGEKVNGIVCFAIDIDDCFWSESIEIVKCGEYFVYNLPEVPTCHLRYCAA